MLSLLGLQGKAKVSDAQLDTEIIDEDIHILAGCFDAGHYSDYLDKLGLNDAERADVGQVAHQQGHQAAIREAIRRWKGLDPSAATFRNLLIIVLKLGKQRVAEALCKFVTENYRIA